MVDRLVVLISYDIEQFILFVNALQKVVIPLIEFIILILEILDSFLQLLDLLGLGRDDALSLADRSLQFFNFRVELFKLWTQYFIYQRFFFLLLFQNLDQLILAQHIQCVRMVNVYRVVLHAPRLQEIRLMDRNRL